MISIKINENEVSVNAENMRDIKDLTSKDNIEKMKNFASVYTEGVVNSDLRVSTEEKLSQIRINERREELNVTKSLERFKSSLRRKENIQNGIVNGVASLLSGAITVGTIVGLTKFLSGKKDKDEGEKLSITKSEKKVELPAPTKKNK